MNGTPSRLAYPTTCLWSQCENDVQGLAGGGGGVPHSRARTRGKLYVEAKVETYCKWCQGKGACWRLNRIYIYEVQSGAATVSAPKIDG